MLRIRNWKRFQHFRDRRPPWVKLYRELLEDPDWHELDGDAAKVLVMLWLIASEDPEGAGTLPDIKKTAFRLRMTERAVTSCIQKLSSWLEQDDINAISSRYQDDPPERETETETQDQGETETETDLPPKGGSAPRRKNGGGAPLPPCPYEEIKSGYNALAADVGMPQCVQLSDARKKLIRARWIEHPEPESWAAFWEYVRAQPFLHGENDRQWRANLDWVLKPANFLKIIEEAYIRD